MWSTLNLTDDDDDVVDDDDAAAVQGAGKLCAALYRVVCPAGRQGRRRATYSKR